jgi:hypothetical protein
MSRYAYWIAALLFLALVLTKFSPQSGFTSLLRFGARSPRPQHSALQGLPLAIAPDSNGYDGQFYAQLALDPLLRSAELTQILDAPAYRARRILAPAVAAVLGLGHPWWTLQAYALLNVICWLTLGWLLRRSIAGNDWVAFARWAGCMFSMGVLDSVRQSLVDLPALLLLVLAANAYMPSQAGRPTLYLALGNLAKETTMLGAIALHVGPRPRWRAALVSLSLAAIPILAWSLYVQHRFSGSIADNGLGNFDWPLLGLLIQAKLALRELLYGNWDGRYGFSLLAILGLCTQAVLICRSPQLNSPWWRIGAAYSCLLLFLSFWVWSGYWAACRAVLPLTIAFNLLLPATGRFWLWWVTGNLTLLHAVWRFL